MLSQIYAYCKEKVYTDLLKITAGEQRGCVDLQTLLGNEHARIWWHHGHKLEGAIQTNAALPTSSHQNERCNQNESFTHTKYEWMYKKCTNQAVGGSGG